MYIMPIANLALLPLSIVGGVQPKDLRVHLSFFFHQTQTWSVGMQASSLVSLSPFVSAYILLLDPLSFSCLVCLFCSCCYTLTPAFSRCPHPNKTNPFFGSTLKVTSQVIQQVTQDDMLVNMSARVL